MMLMIGAAFFLIFNYGGHLYTSGQTIDYRYYGQMLKDISNLDFEFVRNYTRGQLTDVDDIKIDLKFKHLMRIEYLKREANKSKIIDPAFKEEEFPAKLTFNGLTQDVKIGLTGKMSRTHLGNPSKWSFEVKVRGDNTIAGIKRFGLLVPTVRGYLTDWLSVEMMKERGLMGIRIDFVNVTINGKNQGLYYLEERFDKHLIENNRLREGIIFKLEKEVIPYKEAKLMLDPHGQSQLLLLRKMWKDVLDGHLRPEYFFDMEKMAKLFAIADLINIGHPLNKENLRFYFNPVTGLVEPIAREFENIAENDPSGLKIFFEKPEPFSTHFWHSREAVISTIINNQEFRNHYLQELAIISQKEFLDDFFKNHEEKIQAIESKLYRAWPYYQKPDDALYRNQEYLRSIIFSSGNQAIAWLMERQDKRLKVYIDNQSDLPLVVTHLAWKDSIIITPEKPVQIEPKAANESAPVSFVFFNLPAEVMQGFSPSELRLCYHVLGLPMKEESSFVRIMGDEMMNEFQWEETLLTSNLEKFAFVKKAAEDNFLIPAGKWVIDQDLIVPPGGRLKIEAGAEIDLIDHAKIISYSPVLALGTQQKPILVTSSDSTGQGLIVLGTAGRSILSYTHFGQLTSGEAFQRPGSSAVTFLRSPVDIVSCTFSNHLGSDAYLKLIKSDFAISESRFENITGSALACRSANGSIVTSIFSGIERDALFLQSAKVDVSGVEMRNIGRIGIHADDKSRSSTSDLHVRNAETAIASKDGSDLSIRNVLVAESKIGLDVFEEEMEYGPAMISANKIDFVETDVPYRQTVESTLIIDGANQGAHSDSGQILYGKLKRKPIVPRK